MTTPAAPADDIALPILRDGATLYVLNASGTNRWSAQVQPGRTDDDTRVSDAECKRIATILADRASHRALPFESSVARRKWAELQDRGYRMQTIHFAQQGHYSGSIDPWGVVRWDSASSAGAWAPLFLHRRAPADTQAAPALTDDQWLELAFRHAATNLDGSDFLRHIKAVCRDYEAIRVSVPAQAAPADTQGVAVPTSIEVAEALFYVDDFIARCNGDDRGSCESVNVLRRALATPGATHGN